MKISVFKFFLLSAMVGSLSVAGVQSVNPVSKGQVHAPDGLCVELLQGKRVVDITDPVPEFGWVVHSSQANDRQSAYRILVASKPALLDENRADIWDSRKQLAADSINVSYAGKALKSGTRYYWKVKSWCLAGGESEWSRKCSFTTGDLNSKYLTTRHPLVQSPIQPRLIKEVAKGHYLIDFGKVAFGYLQLEINSPAAGLMEVHLGERGNAEGIITDLGHTTVRYFKIEQQLKKGVNDLKIRPPLDKRNTGGSAVRLPAEIGVITPFRYVELVNCPVPLEESMIHQIAVHYPFDENASLFESSDSVLNDIQALCKYSMKATSFCGVYVDGDRERIPYEADAYINQLSHYAVDREYALARYSHEYLLKKPTWPTEWKQHSVLMAWTDYMYTGNTESLARNYEVLRSEKMLEQHARGDGLLNTKGLKDIIDWPVNERDGYKIKEVNNVINAFYYQTLLHMADIAATLGKEEDAAGYRSRAAVVYTAFNKVFFDKKRGIYIDTEGSDHAAIHANMMPLAFGLVPVEYHKRVSDYVLSRGMACSVYGAQYLMEGLYNAGRSYEAYDLLVSQDVRSWYNMIRVGSTITLEAWDNRFKGNQDWNHAWGAVPGNIIARYLLGVRPLEAGFGKVLIRPMPGSLESVEAKVPTIRGAVGVNINNVPGQPFELKVSLPVNTTARIEVPLPGGVGELIINGKVVKSRQVHGFAVIDNLGSGVHKFTTTSVVKKWVRPEPPRVEIIKAVYGSDEKNIDVTEKLNSFLLPGKRRVALNGGYNKHFGDPHHKTVKKLTIQYKIGGIERTKSFEEDTPVILD
ncbi:MAG: alpha-L-rhamnosidase [Kiritimatiellae bacterium]|nr:alpha-L-rhamnosidase [Kiritimatiellia bacterium]